DYYCQSYDSLSAQDVF
nr:immunoglobulin light chain junction region [Macaca mulatta]